MTDAQRTLALVGATGGAGTTRLAVEFAATLARDGRDACVLDAAYATQGLAGYLQGRIDPDVTALVTEDRPLEAGLVELPVDAPGRVACCPAYAPFERLARAKTPAAAERFEDLVREAAREFDAVLVDTPPVAANQAVAGATVADRTVVVASERGRDAAPRMRDRLADVGAPAPRVLVNRADETGADGIADADAAVPESDVASPAAAPVCAAGDDAFQRAVVAAVEATLGISLDVEFEERLLDRLQ